MYSVGYAPSYLDDEFGTLPSGALRQPGALEVAGCQRDCIGPRTDCHSPRADLLRHIC